MRPTKSDSSPITLSIVRWQGKDKILSAYEHTSLAGKLFHNRVTKQHIRFHAFPKMPSEDITYTKA